MEKITMMGGTLGYMAPALPYTGKATKESDVYSFGILMLEVVCGRTPINLQVEDANEDFLLLHSVWRAHEAGNILKAVEPGLLHPHRLKSPISSRTASDQITLLINAADPEARPSMRGEQSYYADSPMATLNLIPPLPSTMPIYGDLLSGSGLQAPKSSKAPLDMLKRNKFTVLRSRFLSC